MLNIGSNISDIRIDGSLSALRKDLDAFLEFGLTAAEIPVHGVDAIRNGRCDRHRVAELKSILADYPFRYSTHVPNPLNLMDREDPGLHRDVLYASLECSSAIGASVMAYHPGRYLVEEAFGVRGPVIVTPREKQAFLDYEAQVLQKAADAFPNVTIAMENARPYLHHSPYCYAESPSALAEQVERIARPNVRMTLDFGHLHLSAHFYDFDMTTEISRVARHIAHCHVHDNFGRSVYHTEKIQTHQIPFGRGDSHMPVGWGNIPFKELLSTFILDYQGLLICELRGRYFEKTGEAMERLAMILSDAGALVARDMIKVGGVEQHWI